MWYVRLCAALVLGVCLVQNGTAQSTFDQYGSIRADGLGQATTASPLERGVHANPGASAAASQGTVAFYARENFGFSILRYGSVSITAPTGRGTVMAGASTVGFEEYRESHFSAGYANGFSLGTSRRIYMGVTLRYYHTRIKNFGSAGSVAINPGLLVQILPSLHLGAHAVNVNRASLTAEEPLPQTFSLGLSYTALDHVRIVVDAFKDVAFPATGRFGIEVRPVDVLHLRAGMTTEPTRFTWGAGIQLGPILADVAAERHQELGWSPSAALQVQW